MTVRDREPAVSVVSFALLAPLILLLLFGAMEGARVFSTWMVITNEAREAARFGAVRYGTDALPQQVSTYLDDRLTGVLAKSGLVPSPTVAVNETTQMVTVTVYYQVPLVIPIVRDVLPNPFPLAARSAMRGE